MKIRDKLIVITGASQGIGKAITLNIAKKGANIILIARDGEKLQKVVNKVKRRNENIHAISCDVSDYEKVKQTCKNIIYQYGQPDILINCAGFGVWKSFLSITIEEHRQMMGVNYWGTFYLIRELLPGMIEQKRGKIVNISSGSGKFALPVTSGYSASKFAVVGFSEALHRDLKGTGVTISCINPGSVKTGFWNKNNIDFKSTPKLVRYSPKLSPEAVARWVNLCIWLPISTLTVPIFVGLLAKLNAIWIRFGDLLLWKWFFPVLVVLILIRILIQYVF